MKLMALNIKTMISMYDEYEKKKKKKINKLKKKKNSENIDIILSISFLDEWLMKSDL